MRNKTPPFFSIGVTTYDRTKLLQETIYSILRQTLPDFEVIVSNDNPQRKISAKSLGIKDPRIRFINQTKNLGERKNMNFLFKVSRSKYFTWFADDDLYHPKFLEVIHRAIKKFNSPPCVFASFTITDDFVIKEKIKVKIQLLSGRQFLKRFLNHSLHTIGSYGVFKRGFLKKLGGVKKLGRGFRHFNYSFGPYADTFLAIQAGLLDRLVFIDTPLIFYRHHKDAISIASTDLTAYFTAQEELCQRCLKIFQDKRLKEDFRPNLFFLLKWFLGDFTAVVRRSDSIKVKQIVAYLKFLKNEMVYLKGSPYYLKMTAVLFDSMGRLFFDRLKKKASDIMGKEK